jgi:D-threo-aldose 1-dehydrogenase
VPEARSTYLRQLGQSGLQVSSLGFGAAPIGNLYQPVTDVAAIDCVQRAVDLGIGYIDTAPHYGFGLSESRVGSVLVGLTAQQRPLVSTKVGRLLEPSRTAGGLRHGFADAPALEPVFDYTFDGVMRSFEASLSRLQIDSVDILYAHDLGRLTHGEQHSARFREFMDGGYRAMSELRAQGLVSAIGLGANEWEICAQALGHADFDCFLLAGRYTLLEQSACETFFPLCQQRQVSVVLGGPFNSGILASGVCGKGPHYYNYAAAPDEIIARVRLLESVCKEFDLPLAAAALQFPGAHPQISSVLAGLANVAQVEQAVAWMNYLIPDDFWQCLRDRQLLHPNAPIP